LGYALARKEIIMTKQGEAGMDKEILEKTYLNQLRDFINQIDGRLVFETVDASAMLKSGQNKFFQTLIDSAVAIELFSSVQKMADALHISKPSLERWRLGKSAPHPIARPSIFRFLRDTASLKISELKKTI